LGKVAIVEEEFPDLVFIVGAVTFFRAEGKQSWMFGVDWI